MDRRSWRGFKASGSECLRNVVQGRDRWRDVNLMVKPMRRTKDFFDLFFLISSCKLLHWQSYLLFDSSAQIFENYSPPPIKWWNKIQPCIGSARIRRDGDTERRSSSVSINIFIFFFYHAYACYYFNRF